MVIKKFCAKTGCSNLCEVSQRYCHNHKYMDTQSISQRNKEYDKEIRHKRDKQYSEFYHSPEWIAIREYILNKYKWIDIYAYYIEKKIVPASTTHHIVEIKDDWELRAVVSNLFPVSDQSHKRIHALYKRDKQETQRLLRDLLIRWRKEMILEG